MATLILTAVGTAIGGPIGGAIGAILGQQVDQAVFAPKPRHGPRLGDLAVQTSSYGTEIPKIFGMIRVAGTVIWATDLIESRSSSGGGKGRPKTVSYAYSANFAVALSGRPIRGVRRIWADGKLLRGSAGDFKTATGYRLHVGGEDQAVDPLIASALGTSQASAFRGTAYAVFENFQLEDYGNRIPSLTFEVEADSGPVAIGTIAESLSDGAILAGETPAVIGYAASGDSIRSAVEMLADAVPLSLADRDDVLRLGAVDDEPIAIGPEEESGRREMSRRAAASLPSEVSLAYYDVSRDYQTGLQRALIGGAPTLRADRRSLAAALHADMAKGMAEKRLAAQLAARTSMKVTLGWGRCAIRPGDRVSLLDEAGSWRVRRWTLGASDLVLDLERLDGRALPAVAAAAPGIGVGQPDLPHGATILRLLDLPLGEPIGGRPLLFVAAAGVQPGWRRAALLASFDGGASWHEAGTTAPSAVIGTTLSTLGAEAGSALVDRRSSVEVELSNEAMWLEDADEDMLSAGANLAAIGDELIQFGQAEWLGGRRFRLATLLRGRRGTEWAIGMHASAEPFTLIESDSLAAIEAPAGMIGGPVDLLASGVGDSEPVAASILVAGQSLRPPHPVHLTARWAADGGIAINWVRRSRLGWTWPSADDAPLGEESEAYQLVLSGAGFDRRVALAASSYVYSAIEQEQDGFAGTLQISVSQIGTHAPSRAAAIIFE